MSDSIAAKSLSARPRIRCAASILALILVAGLAGCDDEGPRLSVEEAHKCATDKFEGHPGTFSQRSYAIAYCYDSPNGRANVIVTFDERRRPVSTFFQAAPHGSHEELMNAAQAIKDCVAYGRIARGSNNSRGATSMIDR